MKREINCKNYSWLLKFESGKPEEFVKLIK
jgi:hypothetical protein